MKKKKKCLNQLLYITIKIVTNVVNLEKLTSGVILSEVSTISDNYILSLMQLIIMRTFERVTDNSPGSAGYTTKANSLVTKERFC